MTKKKLPTNKAIQQAIKDGTIELGDDGKYRLTSLGKNVVKHLKSEPNQRN
jgi:hypothetical protein